MAKRGLGGFTLIELMVAIAILMLLTGLAVPMARSAIKRQKERELRGDLREMRTQLTAIRTLRTGCCCGKKATTADIPSRSMCW